jgi:hypothetical protein
MQPFFALLPEGGEHAAVLAEHAAAGTDPLTPIESVRQATADWGAALESR